MARVRLLSVFVLTFALRLAAYQSAPQADAGPAAGNVTAWEEQLQSDPDNAQLRGNLLTYYMGHGPVEKYFAQALWMVQHHPEAPYAALATNSRAARVTLTEPDYALLKSAWEQALIDHADDSKVLYHAGLFFMRRDPVRAVHQLEQARQLDSENAAILRAESTVYASAFAKQLSPSAETLNSGDAQTLQGELAAGSDPALLAEVGSNLIRFGQAASDPSLKAKGTELINKAISLDPTNEKWKTAAERATLAPPQESPSTIDAAGAVRVGGRVAEANLVRKVDPVYPANAMRARVSGVVEFTALIGEDGHIQNLQLVRGHPLFVNPAKEAVLQYLYRPTMLNGNPVRVITSITVPFQVPSQ